MQQVSIVHGSLKFGKYLYEKTAKIRHGSPARILYCRDGRALLLLFDRAAVLPFRISVPGFRHFGDILV